MTDSMRLAREASVASRAPWLSAIAGLLFSTALSLSAFLVGCGPSDGSDSVGWSSGAGSSGSTAGAWTSGASGTTSGTFSGASGAGDAGADAAIPPMVVEVDPGGTLSATPGNGVGVFTQYVSGGHWLLWWTCDTNLTGQSCVYNITVNPVQGTLSNARSTLNGITAPVVGATPSGFVLTSGTSTARNQVTFDTEPGDSIQVYVGLEPQPDQNYLFFVQNQLVNGGYMGRLTDPLILEPASP